MSRLQSVLRTAAQLVLGLSGRSQVSTAMHDTLHKLTFPQRVTFTLIYLLTYKYLHGLAPDYLSRFCTLLTSVLSPLLLRSRKLLNLILFTGATRQFLSVCPSVCQVDALCPHG